MDYCVQHNDLYIIYCVRFGLSRKIIFYSPRLLFTKCDEEILETLIFRKFHSYNKLHSPKKVNLYASFFFWKEGISYASKAPIRNNQWKIGFLFLFVSFFFGQSRNIWKLVVFFFLETVKFNPLD